MAFGFKIDSHGAYIVPKEERLTRASLHGPEIDSQITALIDELLRLGPRMKAAVAHQQSKPPVQQDPEVPVREIPASH